MTWSPMLQLFIILALGSALGSISFYGFGLRSAAVLLVALVCGHFGFSVPIEISDFGVLLFVYASGLSAGSRFFRSLGRYSWKLLLLGIVPVIVSALTMIVATQSIPLAPELSLGLFSGAITSTPAFAAALDALKEQGNQHTELLSVGYGFAYPFGMLGVALIVQLLPLLVRNNLKTEAQLLKSAELQERGEIEVRHYRITNLNCVGQTLRALDIRQYADATISRITRGTQILAADPDLALQAADVVSVVSTSQQFHKLAMLLGEEVKENLELGTDIIADDIEVSLAAITLQPLQELNFYSNYKVIITRVRREGIEFTPDGTTQLEIGDSVRVVGEKDAVRKFTLLLGEYQHKIQETHMLPFLLGILIGITVGSFSIELPYGVTFRLGLGGGCFLVSLLLGHFRKIGRFRIYVPHAARNLCRELGLLMFLAGAGTTAGAHFVEVLHSYGPMIFWCGVAITCSAVVSAFMIAFLVLRMPLLQSLGFLCGSANNSLPLTSLAEKSDSDFAAVAYATLYPISLITKIFVAEVLLRLL